MNPHPSRLQPSPAARRSAGRAFGGTTHRVPRGAPALLTGLLVALLAGCVTPQTETPQGRALDAAALGLGGRTVEGPLPPAPEDWWKAFGDAQLDGLVAAALDGSPSLQSALARVRTAQAQSAAAGAAGQPRFAIDGEASRQRLSARYIVPPPYGGHTFWIGQATAGLSWDLDFWGRLAAQLEQAQNAAAASTLDVESARLALAGAIAQAYVDLHHAWNLHDVAARQLAQREALLALTRQRVDAGLDNPIERRNAEAAVPLAHNALAQAEDARELAVHRLAALAGYGADRYAAIQRPQLRLEAALPLPADLPMDLLSRRPDIIAARLRIDAAMAGREAAHAAFYPDVSLTAFVGLQAIGLDRLVDGDSTVFGATPAIHLPIFDARRLRANYAAATADLDAAVAHYNDTVLDAVRQTADQLTLGRSLAGQIDRQQQALAAAEAAYALAQKRRQAGLATALAVLNAEGPVLQARRDLAALEAEQVIARVTLLLALGGSFDPEPAATGAAAAAARVPSGSAPAFAADPARAALMSAPLTSAPLTSAPGPEPDAHAAPSS